MNWQAITQALLRVITGFLFVPHGYQKVFGLGERGPSLDDPLKMTAAGIELVGGTLIFIGFKTRFVAFICSGMMAVAYFMAHHPQDILPFLNGGELAVLYCFVFLYLAGNGGGCCSIDNVIAGRKMRVTEIPEAPADDVPPAPVKTTPPPAETASEAAPEAAPETPPAPRPEPSIPTFGATPEDSENDK